MSAAKIEKVYLYRNGKRIPYETRIWEGLGYYSMPEGTSYIYIKCPFCGAKVKAYVWSLAGSGKKCTGCDAQFASLGSAFKPIK